MNTCRIGIVAASSVVPMVELGLGVQRMRESGLDVSVHEHCAGREFLFAGSDQQRAESLYEYATSPEIDIVWCARGGYGATRLLPLLAQMTADRGVPRKKLLVGYSDVTALHEFVRERWGWWTLHATMPGALNFGEIRPEQWNQTVALVKRQSVPVSFAGLRFLGQSPDRAIEARLTGGNLTLWAAIAGTPYQPSGAGKIVFFEEVDEAWYRVDRMLTQIEQAGMLRGAKAIVLGDFKNCHDECVMVLKEAGGAGKTELRRCYPDAEAMELIFVPLSKKLGLSIALGLPAGHGPNFAPLPLGAEYSLDPSGALVMKSWEWAERQG